MLAEQFVCLFFFPTSLSPLLYMDALTQMQKVGAAVWPHNRETSGPQLFGLNLSILEFVVKFTYIYLQMVLYFYRPTTVNACFGYKRQLFLNCFYCYY